VSRGCVGVSFQGFAQLRFGFAKLLRFEQRNTEIESRSKRVAVQLN
jgi:hypothetical protein